MNRFERWFLRRLLKKLLGQQQVQLLINEVAQEAYFYYTETNRPTLESHLHDQLQKGIVRAYQDYQ